MHTSPSLPEAPSIPTLPNLRDVGGHVTAGGERLRTGLLFRSVDLSSLDDAGLASVAELGVRTVYDLRTPMENERKPDRVPDGVRRVELDVLRDSARTAPAQLSAVLENPAEAQKFLGDGGAAAHLGGAYRDFVSLPSALEAYSSLYRGIIAADGEPGLFHCTTGKDRTGWAAASLQLFVGVDLQTVMADYLRTNTDLLPSLQPIFDRFGQMGGDPALLEPLLGVREEYLRIALAEVESSYGDIHGWVREGLGLTADESSALQNILLERG